MGCVVLVGCGLSFFVFGFGYLVVGWMFWWGDGFGLWVIYGWGWVCWFDIGYVLMLSLDPLTVITLLVWWFRVWFCCLVFLVFCRFGWLGGVLDCLNCVCLLFIDGCIGWVCWFVVLFVAVVVVLGC